MSDSILGIKISELPEATESDLTDASAAVVDDGTTTRKTKLSTFVSWLKSKLNIGTMQEDINNLNTNMLSILSGESASFDIPAGKHTDVTINFWKAFSYKPVVCVYTQGSGYNFIPVIQNITTNSVTIRAINHGSTAITGRRMSILAVGKLAS